MYIAYISVVDGQVGRAVDSTALTGSVGISLDSGNTTIKAIVTLCCILTQSSLQGINKSLVCLILTDTDNHVRDTEDVISSCSCACIVIAHSTLVAAAIYITHRAAFNIGIRGSDKVVGCLGILCHAVLVVHGTTPTGSIQVLINRTAMQTDVGGSADGSIGTHSCTIAIASHVCTLVDVNVGVGILT